MPTHCCVPYCTKKGYLDENGLKVSYFTFPSDKTLRKKWTHAIRREEGKHFQITSYTKVCSRHFKSEDIHKSLGGSKRSLTPEAVPCVFDWRTSPRKRKPPAFREFPNTIGNTNDETVELCGTNEESEIFQSNENATQTDKTSSEEIYTQTDNKLFKETSSQTDKDIIELMKNEINTLNAEVDRLKKENNELKSKLFNVDRFCSKPSSISFYTGFPDFEVFKSVYDFLEPGENGQNIRYWLSSNTEEEISNDVYEGLGRNKSEKGRRRSLEAIDEFFLVMCRLRQAFAEEHLSNLFHISLSTVSRIVITWVNFMYLKVSPINIWPSRRVIDITMPEAFKAKYSATRVIIDCTEIRCQMPSSLQLNGELYSNYKNHTTLKGLIGISPGGAITFVSELYTGSISDREIVERSGFLDLPFDNNDLVMADKGFTVDDLLRPLGVSLKLPPFLGNSDQMAAEEVVSTQEIASLRIHVERAINKIKNFHIWDGVVPLHQMGLVNQMWAVCAFLCNVQPNIISA